MFLKPYTESGEEGSLADYFDDVIPKKPFSDIVLPGTHTYVHTYIHTLVHTHTHKKPFSDIILPGTHTDIHAIIHTYIHTLVHAHTQETFL
jgi:hypothetical protein